MHDPPRRPVAPTGRRGGTTERDWPSTMRMRRTLATASAVLLVPLGVVFVVPDRADALTCPDTNCAYDIPIPEELSTGLETTIPGVILGTVLNYFAPEPRATAAISWDLQELEHDQPHAAIWSVAADSVNFIAHVPVLGSAFNLYAKGTNWLDESLGISTSIATGVSPNGDVNANGQGWSPYGQPWTVTYDSGAVSITESVVPSETALVYGAQTPATAALTEQAFTVTGNVGTYVAGHAPYFTFSAGVYCENTTSHVVDTSSRGTIWVYDTGQPSAVGGYTYTGSSGAYSLTSNSNYSICPTGYGFDHLGNVELNSFAGTQTPSTGPTDKWYPSGNPSAPVFVSNPEREYELDATCADGTVLSPAYSTQFQETASTFPAIPPFGDCTAHGGLGAWTLKLDNVSTGSSQTLSSWSAPAAYTSLGTTYPECLGHIANGAGSCVTVLWKSVDSGTEWENCFTSGQDCAAWATDPNRSSDYQCTFGLPSDSEAQAAHIAISNCYQFGPTFDLAQRQAGHVYSDPETDPGVGVQTQNDPGGDVTKTTQASSTGQTSTSSDGYSSQYCSFSWGVLFDPLSWVVKPLECAFIPNSQAVASAVSATVAEVEAKPPYSVVAPFVNTLTTFGTSLIEGCTGTLADFGAGLQVPCTPPAGISGYITTFKVIFTVMFFGYTVFDLWRFTEKAVKS